ncbi:S-adenosyl-L-methionine-dependent methyltransferase [Phycomyces nitens]|nr:S-adenosyl-L-methionine-dependent methyltransferase [Phycomyces nitens]
MNHPVFGDIDLSYLTRALKNKTILGTKDPFYFEYGAEKEYDRQTRQHYVLKQTFGSNTRVKLENPKKILEIACGIGLWALEIGQKFPLCEVIGIDTLPSVQEFDNFTGLDHHEKELSIRQLNGAERAKNVKYQYGDILVPLEFPSCTFDYVFQRDVATVVPAARWAGLLDEIYRVLKPNGRIELVEHSFSFSNPGPILSLANEWFMKVAQGLSIEMEYIEGLEDKLLQAGFVDLETLDLDVPVGEWPADDAQKEQGFLYKLQTKAMFQSMRLWWVVELGVESDYYDNLCTMALEELEERKCTMKWKIWTARKPDGRS